MKQRINVGLLKNVFFVYFLSLVGSVVLPAGAEEPARYAQANPQVPGIKPQMPIAPPTPTVGQEADPSHISLDLRDMDVAEALKFLATKASLNIIPTMKVSGRVTLMVNDVPIRDVFDLMIRSNNPCTTF